MKNFAVAGAMLLITSASVGVAHAQVAYTNAALNGCYAHMGTSVDTGSAADNRDVVGTFCFDGKGKMVSSSSAPFLSGSLDNTNGTVHKGNDQNGTYQVTNSPGDGMGFFDGNCARQAFVLKHIDSNGLAHGFSYILIKGKQGNACHYTGPVVIGGNAEYQGPLK